MSEEAQQSHTSSEGSGARADASPRPEEAQVAEPSFTDEDIQVRSCVRVCFALSENNIQKRLDEAAELKLEGNEEFRAQEWNDALATYRRALARLPRRPVKKVVVVSALDDELDNESSDKTRPTEADTSAADKDTTTILSPPSPLQQQCSKARAVLNANIAACYVKLVSLLMNGLAGHLMMGRGP